MDWWGIAKRIGYIRRGRCEGFLIAQFTCPLSKGVLNPRMSFYFLVIVLVKKRAREAAPRGSGNEIRRADESRRRRRPPTFIRINLSRKSVPCKNIKCLHSFYLAKNFTRLFFGDGAYAAGAFFLLDVLCWSQLFFFGAGSVNYF